MTTLELIKEIQIQLAEQPKGRNNIDIMVPDDYLERLVVFVQTKAAEAGATVKLLAEKERDVLQGVFAKEKLALQSDLAKLRAELTQVRTELERAKSVPCPVPSENPVAVTPNKPKR